MVNLCYQLPQAGWQLWYVFAAVVTHFGEASSRQMREEMYLQLYHSKLQFFRKFGGEGRARQARALLALTYTPLVVAAVWSSSATTGRRRPGLRGAGGGDGVNATPLVTQWVLR